MTIEPGGASHSALVNRVVGIILRPKSEWAAIEAEPISIKAMFTSYAMILALIPAIASVIGGMQGYSYFWYYYRPSLIGVVSGAAVHYALGLVAVYVVGMVIDGLAPNFGAEKNPVQAMKVAVYSMTPVWLAGVFSILPALSELTVLGLYSIFLVWVGLPALMKPAPDKTTGYIAAVAGVSLVAYILLGSVSAGAMRL